MTLPPQLGKYVIHTREEVLFNLVPRDFSLTWERRPQASEKVLGTRLGYRFLSAVGIYCDLIFATDEYCPIWFDDRYNRCRPVAEFDLV